jgi:homoserine dehydrogenase
VQGIRDISLEDINYAKKLGYRIKLLAIIKQEDEDVQVRVHPTLIPQDNLMANISDVFNGAMVNGDIVGDTMFYGKGAGSDATASAVVADLVDVALNLKLGSHRRVPAFRIGPQYRHLLPMAEVETRYYLRLQVVDKPGVLAEIADILGKKGISISSFIQREGQSEDNVSLLILTHTAKEKLVQAAISEFEQLGTVSGKVKLFRIEDL